MSELRHRLDREILPLVARPSRYTGGERNARRKDASRIDLSFLLAFPDVYEIGMSHLGLRVLYDILNRRPNVEAEFCFAPWLDMERLMREKGVPLFSQQSSRPACEFDVIGFTLQYELHYTTVLSMLDLAGIPLRAADRDDRFPLVIGGGPCAYNPEPVAEFFDMIVIGDGESVILEIADLVMEAKRTATDRDALLKIAASIDGVYVPSLYEPRYENGTYVGTFPTVDGVPEVVSRRTEPGLDYSSHPSPPVVPLTEIAHDRLNVELMRGCTRGCRFCNAGMVTRPVRSRSAEDVARLVEEGIDASGYEEASLVSLSASDYEHLPELVSGLGQCMFERMVSIALPSLRVDRFSLELAQGIGQVRKPGLTFAPEAGTQRLRDVINKNETDEHLLETIANAFAAGWSRVKLYFMIGLPTETEEDVAAIAGLVRKLRTIVRGYSTRARISVSISPFVPKPHTPFQWEAQDSIETLRGKERLLRDSLRLKGIKLSLRDPEVSFLEGVMARGDRQLSRVIETAWRLGSRLDGWTEAFDFDIWREAFGKTGIDPTEYTGAIDPVRPLYWDHIAGGPAKEYLLAEKEKAERGEVTPDCREVGCLGCGACDRFGSVAGVAGAVAAGAGVADAARRDGGAEVAGIADVAHGGSGAGSAGGEAADTDHDVYGRRARAKRPGTNSMAARWRIEFAKSDEARFLSHLDVVRNVYRALRMSRLPLAYSQGFNPHPRVSFGPPLPVGVAGRGEFLDVEFGRRVGREEVQGRLGDAMPDGLDLVSVHPVRTGLSIVEQADAAEYEISDVAGLSGLSRAELMGRISELCQREQATVMRRGAPKTVSPSRQILEMELIGADPPTIRAVLAIEKSGSLHPFDVVAMLATPEGGEERLARVDRISLLAQGMPLESAP